MVNFTNWFKPSAAQLKLEWESEWDKMRHFLDTDFFDDEENFVSLVEANATVVTLTKALDQRVRRRTHCRSVEEVEDMVSTYRSAARRKGMPTKLAEMMKAGQPLPMPMVMKRHNQLWIVGGNTRLNIAEILGAPDPKILYVDLDTPEISSLLDHGVEVSFD